MSEEENYKIMAMALDITLRKGTCTAENRNEPEDTGGLTVTLGLLVTLFTSGPTLPMP